MVFSAIFKGLDVENGFDEEKLKKGNMGIIFGGSFILSLISAFVFVLFLGPERDAMFGASTGFMAGLFELLPQWESRICLKESL